MSKYARIVDSPSLIRDLSNQAILNTDLSIVRKHEGRQRELDKDRNREIEINNLKSELSDIKKMLQALLSKGTG
jgi:hypothetical protein